MRYSFSGTVSPTELHKQLLVAYICEEMGDCTEVTTGLAPGIDTLAMLHCHDIFPNALHRVIIPAGKINEKALDYADEHGFEILEAPLSRHPYRPRNIMLVQFCDKLVAVPEGPEHAFRRSGTWMTVRIARAHSTPVEVLHSRRPK